MRAYDCIVRPAGQITHEVPKMNVSAKEIVLLMHIHGRDAVNKVRHVGTMQKRNEDGKVIGDYDEQADLQRLAHLYGPERVQKVFGVFLEPFDDDDRDTPNDYITDMSVIRAEANNEEVPMADVAREAGNHRPAPNTVNTEPFYADETARAAAAAGALE